jgi:hypothetical protein
MVGMTELLIKTSSKLLIANLQRELKTSDVIQDIEATENEFHIFFHTEAESDVKETIFNSVVQKVHHVEDPADRIKETQLTIMYQQQANKEYYFSTGQLVRYRGFIDTDNPIPMLREFLINL